MSTILSGLMLAAAFEGRYLHQTDPSNQAELKVIPAIRIDQNTWLEPGENDCSVQGTLQECRVPGYGVIRVRADGTSLLLSFQAERSLSFRAIGWRGTLRLPGARGWLSHGFQSWSQTGVVSLQAEATAAKLESSLALTGEDEIYRRGREHSWWYSFVGSDQMSFLAGANTADRLRSYVQFYKKSSDVYGVKMISGAGETVALQAGASIGESWTLSLGEDLQQHLDIYASALKSRHKTHPTSAQAGWNSWYDLWDDVNETQFLANIKPVQEFWQNRLLPSAGPLTMTLDDGWEQAWGDWYPNSKFPSGVEGVAKNLASQSIQLGLWIAPLLVHPNSAVAKAHPGWLVKDASYKNPSGTVFRVLDVSQAEVARHLQDTIKRLTQWGAKILKIDFLFAGALEGGRSQPWTGMQSYQEALRLIREAAGPGTVLNAVGAPPVGTFAYVDAWRVGGDIAFKPYLLGIPKPGAVFIANQARSIAGRQPYCQVTLCDGDPALLRSLTQDEVGAGVWVAAAAGGAMVLSDDMTKLDRARWTWGYDAQQLKNGWSGHPARLSSYFPPEIPDDLNSMKDRLFTAEQKVPELWIMPDGSRVLINFGNGKKTVEGIEVPKNASRVLD